MFYYDHLTYLDVHLYDVTNSSSLNISLLLLASVLSFAFALSPLGIISCLSTIDLSVTTSSKTNPYSLFMEWLSLVSTIDYSATSDFTVTTRWFGPPLALSFDFLVTLLHASVIFPALFVVLIMSTFLVVLSEPFRYELVIWISC